MTREEAITELSVLHERFNNGMGWRDGEYEEAIDMAIEALQQEPIVRCKDCRYNTNNPRLFYSKDMIMIYAWCSMIIDASNGEGFCNFAKDLESEEEE